MEYTLCSGDPDSLDAILLPRLGVAIVDGTAPHVVEPKYPGAVEEYVNLGRAYQREGLQEVKGELMSCMTGYKACYQRAYRCLGAAAAIQEDLKGHPYHPRPGGAAGQTGQRDSQPGAESSSRAARTGKATLSGLQSPTRGLSRSTTQPSFSVPRSMSSMTAAA